MPTQVPTVVFLIMLVLSGLFFAVELCAGGADDVHYNPNFMYEDERKGGLKVVDNIRKASIRMLDS